MKQFFIVILLVVGFTACQEPERNCTDFKTGTFTYEVELNGEKLTGEFIRYKDIQVETYENSKVDSSAINWVNDCEFIAKNLHPKSMNEKKPLLFKILTTSENSYTFEFSYVGDISNRHKGTATKVN